MEELTTDFARDQEAEEVPCKIEPSNVVGVANLLILWKCLRHNPPHKVDFLEFPSLDLDRISFDTLLGGGSNCCSI